MDEDQRMAKRLPVPLDICLGVQSVYTPVWKTRDISIQGAFVAMPPDGVDVGAPVEAIVTIKNGAPAVGEPPPTEVVQIAARVVRRSEDGIGLAFTDYDSRAYSALVNLIYRTGNTQ
ncbi:MAG TPA: PilZ domain-containing protein [Acidiferrobacterales bacterium]|jgi:hypothetical protein